MKKLLLSTNNAGKAAEIKAILSGLIDEIVTLADLNLYVDPKEDGDTFFKNAMIKAKAGCEISGLPTLADDSGLCVRVMGGAPGVHSARFAGENATSEQNNLKMANVIRDVPEGHREACYACCMALYLPDGRAFSSYGECAGVLTDKPAGSGGFGYDPYFYLPDKGCTMAELPVEKKNEISHRFRALRAMRGIIEAQKL